MRGGRIFFPRVFCYLAPLIFPQKPEKQGADARILAVDLVRETFAADGGQGGLWRIGQDDFETRTVTTTK